MTKLLPIPLVLASVLSCLFLTACDALTSNATRLARAQQALEEGKPEPALADVRNALDKDQKNAQAHLLLARIDLKFGDGQAALKEVQSAASAGAGDDPALSSVRDQALLLAGKYDELVASQPAGSQAASSAHQVIVAQALAALDRRDEATQKVDSVLAAEPRNVQARLLKVRLLRASGDVAGADAALKSLLSDAPDNARAWMLQGQFHALAGDYAAAAADFGKAVPVATVQLNVPEQARLLAAWTESLLETGDRQAAATAVAQLKKRAPQWPVTNLLDARVMLLQGDANSAVATLQRLLAKDPQQSAARLQLAVALFQQGSVEQARAQLTSLVADEPGNLEARKLLARVYAQLGDTQEAQHVLTDLPQGTSADPTTDWMRSALLSMSGQRGEALTLLEQAARADPNNVPMQLDLARTYLAAGRREDASQVLAAVPTQKSGWAGRQLLVLTRLLGVSESDARSALAALAAQNPHDGMLLTVIGQALLQFNQPEAAAERFREALAADGKLAPAHIGLAVIAMRTRDFTAAQKELQTAVAVEPGNELAYLGLATLASQQQRQADARQWLERAISANPGAVESRLALAQLSFHEKKIEAADSLLKQAVDLSRDKPTILARVGNIDLQAARPEQAVAAFEAAYQQRPSSALAVRLFVARRAAKVAKPDGVLREWLQKQPEDVAARTALASYQLESGDLRGARDQYERLVQKDPAPVLLNNLAWIYQQTGDQRAQSIAKRAYDGAPDNPRIIDTYGWILLQSGHVQQARPLLQKAAQMLPQDKDVQEHYQRALGQTEK